MPNDLIRSRTSALYRLSRSRMRYWAASRSANTSTICCAVQAPVGCSVTRRLPAKLRIDPIRDIQVLCPMNRGSVRVRELNERLQAGLNPLGAGDVQVERFGVRFRTRDKVIQTENNYAKEVFNGDIGQIESIDGSEQEVRVRYDQRLVTYDYGELDEVSLAYAISIHKSQGSEFPIVVIPVAMQQYMLLERNLIYTGITRGKRSVVLAGETKALSAAIRKNDTRKRHSGLLVRLRQPNCSVGAHAGKSAKLC
jgi:exodeoxyribonuclease V alpha subunit